MSNPIRPTRRHSLFRGLSLAALALSGGLYGLVTEAGAQEPPPLIRSTTSAARALTDSPRQHDLMQVLLEFAPGAATASHRVNGRGIFTVVSGEITRIEEGGDTKVFKAGETFPEDDSDHFDVDANRGSVPARLLATFLLQPGAEPLYRRHERPTSVEGAHIRGSGPDHRGHHTGRLHAESHHWRGFAWLRCRTVHA